MHRADPEFLQHDIFAPVHGRGLSRVVVVVPEAMEQTVDDVQSGLHARFVIAPPAFALGDLATNDDFYVEVTASPLLVVSSVRRIEIKGQHVRRSGDPLVLGVQAAHFRVVGEPDRDFSRAKPEHGTGRARLTCEPAPVESDESPGGGNLDGQSGSARHGFVLGLVWDSRNSERLATGK